MNSVLFIVGMHRSGTSALSGMMRFCGYEHGRRLLDPAQDNPTGFWEPGPVMEVNDRVLAAMGASWHRVPAWLTWPDQTPADAGAWMTDSFADVAADAWDRAFGTGPAGNNPLTDDSLKDGSGGVSTRSHPKGDPQPEAEGRRLVCKDPRLCLTLPLWLQVARAKGFAASVLCIHREPRAIMASLTRRNGLDFAAVAALITDYWWHAIQTVPEETGTVRYETLLQSPEDALGAHGITFTSGEAAEQARAFLAKGRALAPPPMPVSNRPLPRPLLRLSKALLAMADGTPPDEIRSDLKDLGLQRIDQKTYQGRSYCLASSTRAVPSGPTGRRVAILHCHIFKNAGSSVDILLRETFGTRFIQQEFATRQGDSNADLVRSFIRCRTDMDAFSTHTGDWWLHYGDKDLLVLPILFLRHPLLRIQSAYRFERTQDADTYGARMAKTLGFADYVRNRLERPRDFAFRNFQARRVAAFESRTITDLASLARTGFERLPFLGIVEDFDASIRRLEAYLRPHFPAFTARPVIANRTDGGTQSLAERLDAIRSDLGKDLYRDLRNANDLDFHLYDAARARDALAA